MNLAAISLAALAFTVVLSCFSQINPGIVAIAMAWIIGVYLGGMPVKQVAAGFPVELFLTLAGVTLLFAQAQVNGTLDRISKFVIGLCRGNAGVLPILFFCFAAVLASIGPGNIATAALLAPAAMAAAQRSGIPVFLMAIMVGNGANAGSLSPFAPTGIIVNGLMEKIHLGGHGALTWWYNLSAHAAVAFAGYFLFGGWRLFRRKAVSGSSEEAAPFQTRHWATMAVIGALVASVLLLKVHIGMAAFTGAALLALTRTADDAPAVKAMPWSTILMVCGVSVLIAILEKVQGIQLFASLMASISTPATVTPIVAFLTGLVSAYSSTSGVVLPAFLPTVPELVARLGGGNPLAIASAMNVGGHLVDVSPLSTIGALCVAGVLDTTASRNLFHQLLAWGLSMCLIGALFSYAFF